MKKIIKVSEMAKLEAAAASKKINESKIGNEEEKEEEKIPKKDSDLANKAPRAKKTLKVKVSQPEPEVVKAVPLVEEPNNEIVKALYEKYKKQRHAIKELRKASVSHLENMEFKFADL